MKKLKGAVMIAAVMGMLGFTSCLDGDGENVYSGGGFVTTQGFDGAYSFRFSDGSSVVPTNQELLEGKLPAGYTYYYIQYSFTSEENTGAETSKSINAEINYLVPIKTDQAVPAAPSGTSGNAPVIGVNTLSGASFGYYDRNNIFVPISYAYKSSGDEDELDAEYASHRFFLYYDTQNTNLTKDRMYVELRHTVDDPSLNDKRTSVTGEWRHFNIQQIVSMHQSKFGTSELPDQIVVEYEQASSGSYEQTYDRTAEIAYGSLFEQ